MTRPPNPPSPPRPRTLRRPGVAAWGSTRQNRPRDSEFPDTLPMSVDEFLGPREAPPDLPPPTAAWSGPEAAPDPTPARQPAVTTLRPAPPSRAPLPEPDLGGHTLAGQATRAVPAEAAVAPAEPPDLTDLAPEPGAEPRRARNPAGRSRMLGAVTVLALGAALLAWQFGRPDDAGVRRPLAGRPAAAVAGPPPTRSQTAHLPCKFIGLWSFEANGVARRVVLQDNGRYLLNPDAVLTGRELTGRWAVQGPQFVWHHDQHKPDEADVNVIAEEGPEHFVLTEMNGSQTRFDLVAGLSSERCTP